MSLQGKQSYNNSHSQGYNNFQQKINEILFEWIMRIKIQNWTTINPCIINKIMETSIWNHHK